MSHHQPPEAHRLRVAAAPCLGRTLQNLRYQVSTYVFLASPGFAMVTAETCITKPYSSPRWSCHACVLKTLDSASEAKRHLIRLWLTKRRANVTRCVIGTRVERITDAQHSAHPPALFFCCCASLKRFGLRCIPLCNGSSFNGFPLMGPCAVAPEYLSFALAADALILLREPRNALCLAMIIGYPACPNAV